MNRKSFGKYICDTYGVVADYPFSDDNTTAVYRHKNNKKWFALVMTIPKVKLGIKEEGAVDVVNLKCDPLMIGSFLLEEGIHRAYHMNKNHWITLRLDGSVDDDKVKWLLDMSYDLTKGGRK